MRSRIARSVAATIGPSSNRCASCTTPSCHAARSGRRLTAATTTPKESNGCPQSLQKREGEISDAAHQLSSPRRRRARALPGRLLHSSSSPTSSAAATPAALFSSSSCPSSPSEDEGRLSAEQRQPHPSLKLMMYDSLSKSVRNVFEIEGEATPGDSNRTSRPRGVAVYACGPTVYAPAHLGHARTYVCLDVLRRVMEHVTASNAFQAQASSSPSSATATQPQPLFVLNITDVDDKILAAAAASSGGAESPLELARRYEAEFWRDWDALNLLRPHMVTRVTEHVSESIVPYVRTLLENGTAYEAGDGDVYFDVRTFESKMQPSTQYGKLAPASAQSSSEEGSNNADNDDSQSQQSQKRDPRDFALWKRQKPGEGAHWDSPFGAGRPGWHIECSAMIHAVQEQFKDSHVFALHAGGVDLQFPHHCNEIAQAEAYYSNSDFHTPPHEWIPHWVHTGHLYIDGMKMSKSLKNFITIQDLLSSLLGGEAESALSSPADVFRLWCLSSSYRDSVTYSTEGIAHASMVRERIVQLLLDGEEWLRRAASFPFATKLLDDNGQQLLALALHTTPRCLGALTSDLDGPQFLRDLSSLVGATKKFIESDSSARSLPSEPVYASLCTLRNLLRLVGFSDVTTQAGLSARSGSISSSNVVGGERALLDELSRFRASIRNLAVAGIRSPGKTPSSQGDCLGQILAVCDDARDRVLPSLGVELFDHPVPLEDASGNDADGDGTTQWRYCVPRTQVSLLSKSDTTDTSSEAQIRSELDVRSVSPTAFFRVGQYEEQFKEFDADGVPTVMSDGAPVSNRLRKKLQKKLEKHMKRLDGDTP
jgi:cysteinyl-tRNA synthetase